MRASYLLCLLCLFVSISFQLQAQETKNPPAIWLTSGWGGGDGDISDEDYSLMSFGARLQMPDRERLFIFRGEFGKDPFLKKGTDYKLREIRAMWGFTKTFPESGIYGATGISYSHHKIRDKSIPDQGPLPEPSYRNKTIWGMPIELGTHIKITDGFALSGAGFINLNPTDIFVGYLVQVQVRIF